MGRASDDDSDDEFFYYGTPLSDEAAAGTLPHRERGPAEPAAKRALPVHQQVCDLALRRWHAPARSSAARRMR